MTNITTKLNTTLTALIAQRVQWEDGNYKQANAELYAILEECCTIYTELCANKAQVKLFNAAADALGVSFNKGTSLALKIVRVVFGAQSNREFAYARVIKVGFEEKAAEQTLTNFIIEHGGIENVRRKVANKAATALTADDYKDIAENAFTGGFALATFGLESYMLNDEENDTDYIVALVHCDGAGNGSIVYGSNKRGLVSSALAVMGKEIDDLQKATASTDTLADIKVQKAANMKQFLARKIVKNVAA